MTILLLTKTLQDVVEHQDKLNRKIAYLKSKQNFETPVSNQHRIETSDNNNTLQHNDFWLINLSNTIVF